MKICDYGCGQETIHTKIKGCKYHELRESKCI